MRAIRDMLRMLWGGQPADHIACAVGGVELPPEYDVTDVALLESQAALEELNPFTAMAATERCTVTVKPQLGIVNIRTGPDTDFQPIMKTTGGITFELVGATSGSTDGHRWFAVKLGPRSGWVRADMVTVAQACLQRSDITEDDLSERPANSKDDRFALPVSGRISQRYHSQHRGLDMVADVGEALRAVARGECIRLKRCPACDENHRPNMFPCPGWMYRDPRWGFGYGNFVIMRHDYADLPKTMRKTMDRHKLQGGFAYVLYAHMSQVKVRLGEVVAADDLIGLTGHHGCSSAPHLHFEVKIGRDETVDGIWQKQIPVNPKLMFYMP